VLWSMHRLLLWRTHLWPHRDGASPEIVEGGPHRGTPAVVATNIAGATGAVVLAFPFPLALAFVIVAGVGDWRGRGRLRTWQFLLWWARR
jgi:hypothetical protein